MKSVALVSLDCETGLVNRYLRTEGNKPERTGFAQFKNWDPVAIGVDWSKVWGFLQSFRTGYVPPEDPGPRPTSPLRNTARQLARAA